MEIRHEHNKKTTIISYFWMQKNKMPNRELQPWNTEKNIPRTVISISNKNRLICQGSQQYQAELMVENQTKRLWSKTCEHKTLAL